VDIQLQAFLTFALDGGGPWPASFPGMHWRVGFVSPRVNLNVVLLPGIEGRSSNPLPVTILTELSRLAYGTDNDLIPWSRVLLEKLVVTHLVKKFPPFIEPTGWLPSSHTNQNYIFPTNLTSDPYTCHVLPPTLPNVGVQTDRIISFTSCEERTAATNIPHMNFTTSKDQNPSWEAESCSARPFLSSFRTLYM
jgi:hypothetical protein